MAPLYQEGDILSISEKIVALCQKRVVYKKDMRLSWLARFLSKFAMHSEAGIGVDSPWTVSYTHLDVYKRQLQLCGQIGAQLAQHGELKGRHDQAACGQPPHAAPAVPLHHRDLPA